MPIVVFDTGFLYSLVVDRTYSSAAEQHWAEAELWVPSSVRDEMKYRTTHPTGGLPPELPRHALGLISSNAWNFDVLELEPPERTDAQLLRERLGGEVMANHGECEAAVLVATRAPEATIALDDVASVPVLSAYISGKTGKPLSYVRTSDVLDRFVELGRLTAEERSSVRSALARKGRPFT